MRFNLRLHDDFEINDKLGSKLNFVIKESNNCRDSMNVRFHKHEKNKGVYVEMRYKIENYSSQVGVHSPKVEIDESIYKERSAKLLKEVQRLKYELKVSLEYSIEMYSQIMKMTVVPYFAECKVKQVTHPQLNDIHSMCIQLLNKYLVNKID